MRKHRATTLFFIALIGATLGPLIRPAVASAQRWYSGVEIAPNVVVVNLLPCRKMVGRGAATSLSVTAPVPVFTRRMRASDVPAQHLLFTVVYDTKHGLHEVVYVVIEHPCGGDKVIW